MLAHQYAASDLVRKKNIKRGKKKSYSSSAHRGYSETPKENKKTTNFQHLMQ